MPININSKVFLSMIVPMMIGNLNLAWATQSPIKHFANGQVFTANDKQLYAESVIVERDKIVFVGKRDDAQSFIEQNYASSDIQAIDLEGKLLIPGLHDTHIHPFERVNAIVNVDLSGLKSEQEFLEAIKKFADQNPDKPIIQGAGYDLHAFKQPANKQMLDAILADKPAAFIDSDGHQMWVNSKMLELLKIDNSTPDPAGGKIARDANGEATGLLLDDAIQLVFAVLPFDLEENKKGLQQAVAEFNQVGITSIVEAQATDESFGQTYSSLDKDGKLNVRVNMAQWFNPAKGKDQIQNLIKNGNRQLSPRVQTTQVKFFADGTLELGTAALKQPYFDETGKPGTNKGTANFGAEDLGKYFAELDKAGMAMHVHAIGDEAVSISLDAFEQAKQINGNLGRRHTICHMYLVDSKDIPRFAELGILANYQALWAAPFDASEVYYDLLGKERFWSMFPFNSIRQQGAKVTIGSDFPVTPYQPFTIMQVAVTRQVIKGAEGVSSFFNDDILDEKQRMPLEEVLKAYTINGAYFMNQENETGSIEVGKQADLVVLNQNLFDIKPSKIYKTKVLMTMIGGEVVYSSE